MTTSILDLQRDVFLRALHTVAHAIKARNKGRQEWSFLVCDKHSRIQLRNVATDDEVLDAYVAKIEQLEERRDYQPDTKGVYFLSPLPHIVEWLKADLDRRRYQEAYVVWTSPLDRDLRARLNQRDPASQTIQETWMLNTGYFSRESHVVTFGEAHSFQILFNNQCESLIAKHLSSLAQKIVSVCVSLGEYPVVRYFRPQDIVRQDTVRQDTGRQDKVRQDPDPRDTNSQTKDLCAHLARFVQQQLDQYARDVEDFPAPSQRPRATLLITDRSMDLMTPLVHELTYQAMAMDLLPIEVTDGTAKFTRWIQSEEEQKEVEKQFELNEKDRLWIENRHLHMKDLLIKLSDDFRKFQAKNAQFADKEGQNISVNTIKDMLAGLPEFQEGKAAFSLHIDMAERCATQFSEQKLLEITSFEQSLATGLDEKNQRPKNITDQLVNLLAAPRKKPNDGELTVRERDVNEPIVNVKSRVRLLMMYIIYRGGILVEDIEKLLQHIGLPKEDVAKIDNLTRLGARTRRVLGDNTNPYQPLFPSRQVPYKDGEEVSLSRFEPMLRYTLEALCQGTLDNIKFPPVKPHLNDPSAASHNTAQTSLRNAGKPTWANTRPSANKPRQRVIIFMAGGATYAEARACYEVSQQMSKEVFLVTSDMLIPATYVDEILRLKQERYTLGLPTDQRPPELPSGWHSPPPGSRRPQQASSNLGPLTDAMQKTNLGPARPQDGSSRPASSQTPAPTTTAGSFSTQFDHSSGKLKKEKKEKKHHLGFLRKH